MIFFYDAQGNLIKSVPTNVYQGSNKASRIWFIMPTAPTNVVNVAFTLPNGQYAPQRVMTNATLGVGITDGENKFTDETGQVINAWYYDLLTDITAYAGQTKAQFFVTTPPDADGNNEVIATDSVDILVVKGTPSVNMPAPINEYQEIINVLSSVNATIVDIKNNIDNFENEVVDNLQEQFNELEAELNNKFNELEQNSTASQVIKNTNNIKALFNLQLNKNVLAYDNAELTEELQQTGGTELSDLTILDNSYVTVNKISGNTVATDTGLKNAKISGIKSIGRNLIDINMLGEYITKDTSNENYFVVNTLPTSIPAKYKTITFSKPLNVYGKISYKQYNANASKYDAGIMLVFVKTDGTRKELRTLLKNDGVVSAYVEDVVSIYFSFGSKYDNVVGELMISLADVNYEPYTESVMSLPEPVELGKWDYIENGQIVRETIIEAYDSTKYDEVNGTYNGTTDFVLSQDGTQVAYKGTVTSTPIDFNNEYLVWDKGLEQVLTPEDENGLTCFDYGVNTTEDNSYYVIVGGNE
jgi:hypothetical protein